MKYYGGVSWDEQYDMPVIYKHWFLKRLEKEMLKDDGSTEPTHGSSTPQKNINMRNLQNMFGKNSTVKH